jgi:hypothetical protein
MRPVCVRIGRLAMAIKKTKHMKIFNCILFCILFAGVSCLDNVPGGIIPLKGTQWKLAGSVNVETGELREFEPTACAECFTLTFDTDYEASGRSVSSKIAINLLDLRKYMNTDMSETWVEDPSLRIDGDHFRDIMVSIESFTVTSEELKLYHNNNTEYLLFKQDNNPPYIPVPLNGTKWKLAGSVNIETGILKEFEPKDCAECFTLAFDTDSTANGVSVLNGLRIHLWPKPAIILMTDIGDDEIGDAQSYYDAWRTMTSYRIENDELWFLFNNNTEYLLFKQDNNPPDIPVPLSGTKWKLAGSVNVETGELREFEPKACVECFTLTFHSDHEASGLSVLLNTAIDLLDLRKYMSHAISEGSWSGDPSLRIDGDHFMNIMVSIESFTVTTEELKLYHNNKTEYLLFKRIQP